MTKWLEGYFIISTFDKDISCQSWDSNLRTPCITTLLGIELQQIRDHFSYTNDPHLYKKSGLRFAVTQSIAKSRGGLHNGSP